MPLMSLVTRRTLVAAKQRVFTRSARILNASPLPVTRMIAKAAISSELQTKPAVSVSQLARAHRERLKAARVAIFKQQDELQAKLNAIDSELRAVDAYEAAKRR
jgi:hypothetical protein